MLISTTKLSTTTTNQQQKLCQQSQLFSFSAGSCQQPKLAKVATLSLGLALYFIINYSITLLSGILVSWHIFTLTLYVSLHSALRHHLHLLRLPRHHGCHLPAQQVLALLSRCLLIFWLSLTITDSEIQIQKHMEITI